MLRNIYLTNNTIFHQQPSEIYLKLFMMNNLEAIVLENPKNIQNFFSNDFEV